MRDVPPKCTAGFARQWVSSSKRLPRPPANTYAMAERANGTLGAGLVKILRAPSSLADEGFCLER